MSKKRKKFEMNGALTLLLFWFMIRGGYETFMDIIHLFI